MFVDRWMPVAQHFAVALTVAGVLLPFRCRGQGRVYLGSLRTRFWALAVLTMTALAAVLVSVVWPTAASFLEDPFVVATGVPFLLLVSSSERTLEPTSRRQAVLDVATMGLTVLLERLRGQLNVDREIWCQAHVDPQWTLLELESAGLRYSDRLCRFEMGNEERTEIILLHRDAMLASLERAHQTASGREYRRARHDAEVALLMILCRAYQWGHYELRCDPAQRRGPGRCRAWFARRGLDARSPGP